MGKDKYDGGAAMKSPLAETILLVARLLACKAAVTPFVNGQPLVTLNPPTPGATQLSGKA